MGFFATAFQSKNHEGARVDAKVDKSLAVIRAGRGRVEDAVQRLDRVVERSIQSTIDATFSENARITGRRRPDERKD